MSTRERWYALHRARRVFLNEINKRLTELVTFGSSRTIIRPDGPESEFMRRALDMYLNPPHIIDPALNITCRRDV